jgi:hypothetical protein
MNLKYVGGIVIFLGCAMGPFFILGTTGAAQQLQGGAQLLFAALIIASIAAGILCLRGMTKIAAAIAIVSGVILLAMPSFTGKSVTLFPGAIITAGGIIAFLYKEPVMTGSQWRMRRTGTGTGTSASTGAGTSTGTGTDTPPAATS